MTSLTDSRSFLMERDIGICKSLRFEKFAHRVIARFGDLSLYHAPNILYLELAVVRPGDWPSQKAPLTLEVYNFTWNLSSLSAANINGK